MSISWREAYNQIRPDMAKEELRKLIEEVEGGIFARSLELRKLPGSNGEYNQMIEAMKTIRRLQIERLNYPDFNPDFKYDFQD